jgi:hypothetical protein
LSLVTDELYMKNSRKEGGRQLSLVIDELYMKNSRKEGGCQMSLVTDELLYIRRIAERREGDSRPL